MARGYAVPADGKPLRPGCLLVLVQPEACVPQQPLPPGPNPPDPAAGDTTSKGDSLGGTRYSSNRETPTNPVNVWYLKELLLRDRWLFLLSILDNLRVEAAVIQPGTPNAPSRSPAMC